LAGRAGPPVLRPVSEWDVGRKPPIPLFSGGILIELFIVVPTCFKLPGALLNLSSGSRRAMRPWGCRRVMKGSRINQKIKIQNLTVHLIIF
jgi:hypothetical protein